LFRGMKSPEENKGKEARPARAMGCSSWSIWAILLLMLVGWTFILSRGDRVSRTEISYSAFRQQLEQGNIQQVTVQGERLEGELQEPATTVVGEENQEYTDFVTFLPTFGDEQLFSLLQEQQVEIITQPQEEFSWWFLIINALPFIFLIGIGFFLLRNMRSQGQSVFSFAKSRARLYERTDERTTFKDVAGREALSWNSRRSSTI
jgi:cell division protease FtsH